MYCCCTEGDRAAPAVPAPSTPSIALGRFNVESKSWLGRIVTFIEWGLPLAALALVPKCPACVAAYVLLFSGIGLSVSAAATVRWGIIALSAAALPYLLLRATSTWLSSTDRRVSRSQI